MKLKKIVGLGLASTMCLGLVSGTASTASAAVSSPSTVASYIANAEKSAAGNTDALVELDKLKALPREKQEGFVEFATDATKLNAMYEALVDTSNGDTTVLLGGDLQVKSTVTKPHRQKRDTSLTTEFRRDAEFAGIRVAGTQISLSFEYNTSAVTRINACTPSGFNYFPLRSMANDAPSSWISGNNGYCEVRWTIANGWVNGLNLGQRSFIHKAGQGPWGQIENSLRDA